MQDVQDKFHLCSRMEVISCGVSINGWSGAVVLSNDLSRGGCALSLYTLSYKSVLD